MFFFANLFLVAISFSLHAMLPLLANKDEYNAAVFKIPQSLTPCAVRDWKPTSFPDRVSYKKRPIPGSFVVLLCIIQL